jgi:hypothetical protein
MRLPSNIWNGKVVAGPNGCHIFTGCIHSNGYGLISKYGLQGYTHRIIYQECWGPIPEGLQVNHRCNIKRCVNPLHLYAGTQKENMRDLKETGYIHSEETRLKISLSKTGKPGTPHTEEYRLRMKGFSDKLIHRILGKP